MTVVVKDPQGMLYKADIDNTLSALQEIVGGYIEVITVNDHLVMIVNEEGKLLGLEPSFAYGDDILVGPVVFAGYDGEEFRGLTQREAAEAYLIVNGGLIV